MTIFFENRAQLREQQRGLTAEQLDAAGVDVGLGIKRASRDHERFAGRVVQADQQREHAVLFRGRLREEALHDLELQRHDHGERPAHRGGEIDEQRRGDRVRQVGDKLVF